MEICRGAFNYALREIKDWCNSRKCLVDRCSLDKEYIIPSKQKFPTEVYQLNNLPKAKKEFPRLSEVPSQVLQQAIKQVHRSWEYFQERGFGFPRFKKYGQFKSLLFPQFKENPVVRADLQAESISHQDICKLAPTHIIKLPKIGAIPINLHRPIPTGFVVKQARILRKADKWYACVSIQCDVSVPDIGPYGHPIGVDIGLGKFLATSDGVLVKPPKFLKSLQGKLKLLQRRLSRKKKQSKNYEKQRVRVARLHHNIDNTRKDFHFKQAHSLCDAGDMVFMEDLDYRTTASSMLGKHMLGAGFGQFRNIVKYVCWKRGKFFGVVPARGTDQECPECGGRDGLNCTTGKYWLGKQYQTRPYKDLSARVYKCPHCKYITDRVVASSQVIRNRGIALISTAGLAGIESACAVGLPGMKETPSRSEAKPPLA
jgi:putative transposase